MKSHHIKAPIRVYPLEHFADWTTINKLPRVFLAGSIENGIAEQWQDRVVDTFPENVVFLNPRRDDWNSSLKQDKNDPQFNEQVNWELDMLEGADFIFLYFDPSTKSPISLLELGLHAAGNKLIVCCPEGFWRKGNVDIVCARYSVPCFRTWDRAIEYLRKEIEIHHESNSI